MRRQKTTTLGARDYSPHRVAVARTHTPSSITAFSEVLSTSLDADGATDHPGDATTNAQASESVDGLRNTDIAKLKKRSDKYAAARRAANTRGGKFLFE
jgi:hypothetical protein